MQTEKTDTPAELSALDKLGAAIEKALDEAPVSDVLSILTGAFVGLTLEVVRRQGHDVNLPVKVNGGTNRDITIHGLKGPGEKGLAETELAAKA